MTTTDSSKRGSVALMTGLLAVPLVAMTGAAIDLSRAWLVKSRLYILLDAAVLVVARDLANNGTSTAGLTRLSQLDHGFGNFAPARRR